MANINVNVVDGNNINLVVTPSASNSLSVESGFGANVALELYPAPTQVINIDRGVAGNGIESITAVDIDDYSYLDIVYTNGTSEQIGPIGVSSQILIDIENNMVSIVAVADDLSVINDVYANLAAIENCPRADRTVGAFACAQWPSPACALQGQCTGRPSACAACSELS